MKLIRLREVETKDERLIFSWANQIEVRNQSVNPELISIDDHKVWFDKKLKDPNSKMWILEYNGNPAGQVRWDIDLIEGTLDYSIAKKFRRKGLAKILLNKSIQKLKKEYAGIKLIAKVKNGNIASIKALRSVGFMKVNTMKSGYEFFESKI